MTDALVSPRVARERSGGISESTMKRMIAAGQYPTPIVLSRDRHGKPVRIAFVESEVAAWVRRQIAQSRRAQNGHNPR